VTTFGPYPATVVSIHDGDTITLAIDLGFDITATERCRVFGINAPELSTQAGKDAVAYARTVIKFADRCTVISHGWDKYGGRFDGTITFPDGRDFAQLMLDSGHAIPMTVNAKRDRLDAYELPSRT